MKKTTLLLIGSLIAFGSCKKEELTANPGTQDVPELQNKERRSESTSLENDISEDYSTASENDAVSDIGEQVLFFESTSELSELENSDIGFAYGCSDGFVEVTLNQIDYYCHIVSFIANDGVTSNENEISLTEGNLVHTLNFEYETTPGAQKTYVIAVPASAVTEDLLFKTEMKAEKRPAADGASRPVKSEKTVIKAEKRPAAD